MIKRENTTYTIAVVSTPFNVQLNTTLYIFLILLYAQRKGKSFPVYEVNIKMWNERPPIHFYIFFSLEYL